MKLMQIESPKERIEAQQRLETLLQKEWSKSENRTIVWRPDSENRQIFHNGHFWFATRRISAGIAVPRFWNPFGRYHKDGNLQITVEVNIPIETNNRVSGFFARDIETGSLYLMHDGSVGGGRKGIGREAFIGWSGAKPLPIFDGKGDVRFGIVVAPLRPTLLSKGLAHFVQRAFDFKEAVTNGYSPATNEQNTYGDYFREFSGKKTARKVT